VLELEAEPLRGRLLAVELAGLLPRGGEVVLAGTFRLGRKFVVSSLIARRADRVVAAAVADTRIGKEKSRVINYSLVSTTRSTFRGQDRMHLRLKDVLYLHSRSS
jgi:hypothetical protein